MFLALFVTDLDHTLVGDDRAMAELNALLDEYRQTLGTKVAYATGRSPILYRKLRDEKNLLEPDALITAVGTEIYFSNNNISDLAWSRKLSQGWDRDLIVSVASHFADLIPQPDTEQRPFKVSYFLTKEASVETVPQLKAALKSKGLNFDIVYSGDKDLDVLPNSADKGQAMSFLQKKWGIEPVNTVVCGDSGNDISLFRNGEERGIIVGNALTELLAWHNENPSPNRYLAKTFCARGILEGLENFGVLSNL